MEGATSGFERGEVRGYKIEPGANLRGAQLQGADLSQADLEDADLEGANLEGVNLKGAHLFHASLVRANLRRATLEEANLYGPRSPQWLERGPLHDEVVSYLSATLEGADLTEANVKRAIFGEVNMDGANCTRVDFGGVNLGYGSARSTVFASANFKGAVFGGLNIRDSDFRAAYMKNADLDDCSIYKSDFSGADLEEALLPLHLTGCDFSAANLKNATLFQINAQDHILEGGIGIDLDASSEPGGWACGLGNKFRDANLEGARMEFACLFWTDFTGANLTGASLIGANAHKYTTWPEGFDHSRAGLEEYVPIREGLLREVRERDGNRCVTCGKEDHFYEADRFGRRFDTGEEVTISQVLETLDPVCVVFKVPYPSDKAKHIQDVHSKYRRDGTGDLVVSDPDEFESACLTCFVEKRRSQLGL